MIVLAAVLGLFIAIAYILENLRPQMRLVPAPGTGEREQVAERSAA